MRYFTSMSLATKLRVIIIGVAGLLLLVSSIGSLLYVIYDSYYSNIDASRIKVEQTADSLIAVLGTGNWADLTAEMGNLEEVSHLQGALVIESGGGMLAALGDSSELEQAIIRRELPFTEFESLSGWQTTWLVAPISRGAATAALLLVQIDHGEVLEMLSQLLVGTGLTMLFLMIAVIPLSHFLARFLSEPIDSLKSTVAEVTEQQDFSIRAEKVSDDEIGFLVERFNHLLEHLQERDTKLGEYSHNLENSVEELELAKNEAEKAAVLKTQFLANMSHEIRTPMNGVVGMLDLLRGCALSSEQRDYVEIASRSATGLLSIINDILDLSKIEAGKMTLSPVPVAPADVVEEAIAIMYQVARRKEVELVSTIDPRAFDTYQIDPTRLRQVLLNLVGNAVKFTHEGHVLVSCQLINHGETSSLEFRVEDTGIGVDSVYQFSLFEAFGQADGSASREYGGTGLGLTISRQVVNLMDGEIGFVSQEGKGSEFYFNIPAELSNDQLYKHTELGLENLRVAIQVDSELQYRALEQMLKRMKVSAICLDSEPADVVITDDPNFEYEKGKVIRLVHRMAHHDSGRNIVELNHPIRFKQFRNALKQKSEISVGLLPVAGMEMESAKVLLVEDNAVNQMVADRMLRKLGIECEKAGDGLEAVKKITEEEFDLIFMDCQMPRMDGFEATAEIRKYEEEHGARPTPIVALTANAMEEDEQRCISAGMDDYLAKPIETESMKRTLKRWLNGGHERAVQ